MYFFYRKNCSRLNVCPLLILAIHLTLTSAETQCLNVNTSKIEISFIQNLNLNSSINYETGLIEYFYDIMPCTNLEIAVVNIPDTSHFIVFQVHSYLFNVTINHIPQNISSKPILGTNIGLVHVILDKSGFTSFNVSNQNSFPISIICAVLSYGHNTPIPGGCNMEFELKTAPFMKISYNSSIVQVDAQPARLPGPWISFFMPPCTPNILNYESYILYQPYESYSKENYFNLISKMLTLERIKQNGRKVTSPSSSPALRRKFSSYYGVGRVYALVVAGSNMDYSSYVPIHTYACDPQFFEQFMIFSYVNSIILGVCGLWLYITATNYEKKTFTIIFGTMIAVATYIAMSFANTAREFLESDDAVFLIVPGFLLSVKLYSTLSCSGSQPKLIATFFDSLALGILFACVAFYTPLSDQPICSDPAQYWGIFGIVVLLSMIVLLSIDKSDRIPPIVIGSYAIVISLENWVHSNLRYVVFNPLRKVTVEGFATISSPPYQIVDYLMLCLWIVMCVIRLCINNKRNVLQMTPGPDYKTF